MNNLQLAIISILFITYVLFGFWLSGTLFELSWNEELSNGTRTLFIGVYFVYWMLSVPLGSFIIKIIKEKK
jgi:hypothetical protein